MYRIIYHVYNNVFHLQLCGHDPDGGDTSNTVDILATTSILGNSITDILL